MHARFAPVRDCFHDLLASGRETGAGLTIWYDGQPVVDLVGGSRSGYRPGGEPWLPDTLVNVYSVGKPVAALCLLLLVDRGPVDLDAAVDRYWPEFRTPATVRQVLSHTAGLPAFPVPRQATAIADWALLTGDLAAADPEWSPGRSPGNTPGRTGTWWARWSAESTGGRWAGSWPRRSPTGGSSTSASG